MKKKDLLAILGCTATGKTKLAANLAYELEGEVISADSRQVYRPMYNRTGKDLQEFVVNGKRINCHLIDIVDAGEEYNVFEFQKDFLNAYQEVQGRNKLPILCGGTGLYLEAVLKGYRFVQVPENTRLRKELESKPIEELVDILSEHKELHNTTDSIHKKRTIRAIEVAKFEKENEALIRDFPSINYQIFGIQFERDDIKKRITERLEHRLKYEGMIEEVQGLLDSGVSADKLKFYGLEYKFITQFLLGEINRNEMFNKLNVSIHQFAKRQATWFRKMERSGFEINWIDGNLPLDKKLEFVKQNLGV